jgi:copper chaperone CopZ
MTRKLEQEFNLPSMEELKELSQQDVVDVGLEEPKQVPAEIEVTTAITNAEKIDSALPQVNGVEKHDVDMEDIATKAIDSYEELMSLGMNVQDAHAGRIFETAGKMLQIAMDSKNAKVDKKLRMIDLQIRKLRLDAMEGTNTGDSDGSQVMDRNQLLQFLNKGDK